MLNLYTYQMIALGQPSNKLSPIHRDCFCPRLLLTLPIFNAMDPAANLSVTPSDDGLEPVDSESNNGDINFTNFLHFLNSYSPEMQEQDKMSGPPGWYHWKGVMDGCLSGNEVGLDVLKGAGIAPELNSRYMNTCMTTESSSKDTNVHGTDITLEPSANDVDSNVSIHAGCHLDEPDQIVDDQYHSSDFTLIHDVAGDVAPPVQCQNNTVEGMQVQTEGKQPNKKQCRLVLHIRNDHNQTKAHSEQESRLVEDLDKASRLFSFLYIARQAFDVKGDHCPIMGIHKTPM
ncbi:hypothetical protein DFJ58DRAFT_846681 [Suillus subalutaceus]|uniref:uncharacterized protein n=1 Tax=Suillus subalutaceus TaxID=48586 RepID=UPI001B88484F|nr:uncharacterized protein DFJ58DRAFT_846681 [Suillus subalutaceus]KAG1836991.1 hypothetical protein DFJ58DRAFT_846681 [Suillus subalutaceus]